jgi:tetratricopeptide (TPR) repeat protein
MRRLWRPRAWIAALLAVASAQATVMAENRPSPRTLMRFGVEAARDGLWHEALLRWEQALEQDASNPHLRNNLAVAYEAASRPADADREYREARRLFPESKDIFDNQRSFLSIHPDLKADKSEDEPASAPASHKGKVARVTLTVPMPEKIDMTGLRRTLVTRLVVDQEAAEFDLSKEVVNALRRDLHTHTHLDILDVEPPPLPEQPIRELLSNTGFWHRLADKYQADLVISGEAAFKTQDRSGYVQVDEISPLTGQRVRRSRFVTREGFSLDLRLFFLKGGTGELVYEDHFSGDNTREGGGYDRLAAMFEIFDSIAPDVRGIVSPGVRSLPRSLFEE